MLSIIMENSYGVMSWIPMEKINCVPASVYIHMYTTREEVDLVTKNNYHSTVGFEWRKYTYVYI